MKKARIILSALALVAVVGGAFAFKAAKFNGFAAYTLTTAYTTLGTVYTASVPVYLPITPARFITNVGNVPTTVYSTTATTTTAPITLTRVGGGATITFPAWTGVQVQNTFTTAVN
jgi:hypothetical protein